MCCAVLRCAELDLRRPWLPTALISQQPPPSRTAPVQVVTRGRVPARKWRGAVLVGGESGQPRGGVGSVWGFIRRGRRPCPVAASGDVFATRLPFVRCRLDVVTRASRLARSKCGTGRVDGSAQYNRGDRTPVLWVVLVFSQRYRPGRGGGRDCEGARRCIFGCLNTLA